MPRARTLARLLFAATAASSAFGAPSAREERYRALADEAASVRDAAGRRLEDDAGVTEAEVRAALATADDRTKAELFHVAASHALTGLVPDIVAALSSGDPVLADAAARALVSIGDDAVKAGIEALSRIKSRDAEISRRHLAALSARRSVERELLKHWQRKAGSYAGRYKDLGKLGWPVQPVLLAMLLDVPLSDQQIALPETDDPLVLEAAKMAALNDIAASTRRGYRTFDPLPMQIDPDEMFELASQALRDVADIDLMGGILETVAYDLQQADDRGQQRLRNFEEGFYREIDMVLFYRDRPERLREDAKILAEHVERAKHFVRASVFSGENDDALKYLGRRYSEYAQILHALRRFDEAAKYFENAIEITRRFGKESAIEGYNRACSLACGKHKDEAIRQLGRALDRDVSAGAEDLTLEWVSEDGDLESLRDDPRYAAIIKRRYVDGAGRAPSIPDRTDEHEPPPQSRTPDVPPAPPPPPK